MHIAKHVLPIAAAVGLVATTFTFHLGGLRAGAPGPKTAAGQDAEELLSAYAELPLAFVENRGQIDSRVRYYVQGSRAAFFLTGDGLVMALLPPAGTPVSQEPAGRSGGVAPARMPLPPEPIAAGGVALALRFVNRSSGMTVEAEQRAPGAISYLRGRDATQWQAAVPRFARVVYREVWPGVDMVLRGNGAALKYEFRVRAGARPSDILLAYAGADDLSLDVGGGLSIHTPRGVVRDSPPVAWQEIDGAQVPVSSRYVLRDTGAEPSFAFEVGAYDPAHELVIDPDLDYSTFIGGASMDRASGIAVDADGHAYVVGTTQSTDFPVTTGAFDRTFNGGITDVFVAKLDATGSSLVYATYLGGVPTPLRRGTGDNVEFGRAIAVDAGGHAYITGITDSSNFPTTGSAFQPTLNATPNDARDAFVVKLNPSGSGLVYSTFLGGSGFDDGWGIAVDDAGNAYVVGDTDSLDFPVTAGAAQLARGGGRDAFVTKLNAAGSAVKYSTYLGGLDNEVGNGIAVDASGHAFVVGGTRSVDFPATTGSFQPTHSGGAFADLFEGFVAKLNPAGGLVYATFLGGSRIDVVGAVAVDAGGHAYVSGSTSSPDFPRTAGAFDTTSGGPFVAKLTPDGSTLVFSTFLRGGGASALALGEGDTVWVVGTAGPNAPTTAGAFREENSGGNDAWLARLSADGSALEFATFLGGSNTDNGTDLALDAAGDVYVAGTTLSFDFPTTAGAFDTTFAGDPTIFWGDGFVAKFGSGTGTVNPPPTRTTSNFSGTLDRDQGAFHTVLVGSPGQVDLTLDWSDSRAELAVRVRDQSGNQVFFDGSSARPKTGTFTAATAGSYTFDIANTSRRRTTYTLSVTHPFANSFPGGVSFLSLDPTTVAGGSTSTGRVALTVGAPAGGAVVALASSNEAAAQVPATVTVPAGMSSTTFVVTTSGVAANTASTITATYNGTSRSATLGVNAEGGPALSTLALDPTTVPGGTPSTGTVTLTGPAPAGGAIVTLDSSLTDTATVPPSITVAEGATAATFQVSTSQVSFDSSSAISASHGGVTRTVILSVKASGGTAASLSSLAVNPASVMGGQSSTGTVTLTSPAPAGGLVVSLSSSHPSVSAPSSVTVAQGASNASFGIGTSSVAATTSATITASAGGVSRSATLTVTPPSGTATLTVTATGRNGERVLSDPVGIDVAVGTTGSASFPVGTTITLSVTNRRDAIWSGACSTGGEKERTCTFTLNGNASVNANVQ